MASSKPLKGYVVVEVGNSVAGPYAGLVLAELGADVIKVEPPQTGDFARGWGPPFVAAADGVVHLTFPIATTSSPTLSSEDEPKRA